MTSAPSAKKSAATTSSALFWPKAGLPSPPCPPSMPVRLLLLGQEAGSLHQLDVARFFLRHPVGVRLALERRGVERALLHQLLPLRRLLHFLQQLDVVGHLVGRDPA